MKILEMLEMLGMLEMLKMLGMLKKLKFIKMTLKPFFRARPSRIRSSFRKNILRGRSPRPLLHTHLTQPYPTPPLPANPPNTFVCKVVAIIISILSASSAPRILQLAFAKHDIEMKSCSMYLHYERSQQIAAGRCSACDHDCTDLPGSGKDAFGNDRAKQQSNLRK